MKNVKKILLIVKIVTYIVVLLPFSFFPRTKRMVVIYSPFGVQGNAKYVYKELCRRGVACVKFISPCSSSGLNDIDTIKHLSLEAMFYFARAEKIVLTHGLSLYLPLTYGTYILQLWHGIPIKKILLESDFDMQKFNFSILNSINTLFLKARLSLYDVIISSGSHCTNAFAKSFCKKECDVLDIGYPEHYELIQKAEKFNSLTSFTNNRILYAPTWRDDKENFYEEMKKLWSPKFVRFLQENNVYLDIQIHPFDREYVAKHLANLCNERIRFISEKNYFSNNFQSYRIFIVDYSSIIFDVMCVSKNILFYAPDNASYTHERSLYFDLSEIAGESFSSSVNDLLNKIELMWCGKFSVNETVLSFLEAKIKFNEAPQITLCNMLEK